MQASAMKDTINTHGMIVDFGKHRGVLYTRIPVSYLRWMVNSDHSRRDVAQAELDRRGIDSADRDVEISGHAIDSASLRCRKLWHETRGEQEGLHAWLLRITQEALNIQEPDENGYVHYLGLRLVFQPGELYPVLKTVIPRRRPE